MAILFEITRAGWIEQLPNQSFSDASTPHDACITEQPPISALRDIFPEIRASQGANLKDASFALVAHSCVSPVIRFSGCVPDPSSPVNFASRYC